MFFDIAVRDAEMALAAFVLARMTEVRSDALQNAFHKNGVQTLQLLDSDDCTP